MTSPYAKGAAPSSSIDVPLDVDRILADVQRGLDQDGKGAASLMQLAAELPAKVEADVTIVRTPQRKPWQFTVLRDERGEMVGARLDPIEE